MRKKTLSVLLIAFMLCMGAIPVPISVHAASALAGYWNLDEGNGAAAGDLSGQGHAGTLKNSAGWSSGVVGSHGIGLNGTNQYVDIAASVVDTTQSYSVTAWVKLNKVSGFQTAVSMDGSIGSAFYLQLRGDTGKFAFTGLNSDSNGAPGTFASSVTAPTAGTWYHLAGVYDAAAKTVSLYVNGTLQEVTSYTTAWKAAGNTEIGRAKFNAGLVDYFGGQIDDVRLYNGVIDVSTVQSAAKSAYWKLDEGSGSVTNDATGFGHDGTLLNGAAWTAGQIGASAVQLNGSNQSVNISGPVVDTTQSYSVSAWVKPDNIANYRTAVSIDGTQGSAFYLQLRGDTGKFAFTGLNADQAQAAGTFASADSVPAANTWYHLTGVYDAAAKTLSLYMNGALQQTVPYTLAWKAAGNTAIGRGKYGAASVDYWSGAIDDVQIFPFALDPARIIALSSAGSWSFDESTGTIAEDQSPNAAIGNVSGASWSVGRFNNGLSFNGSANSVGMGTAGALNFGKDNFTLAGWFKSAGTGWQRMLSKGNFGFTNGYLLQNSVGVADGHVGAGIGANGSQKDSILFYSNQAFNDGNWHHAAAVFDRKTGTAQLYIDGTAQNVSVMAGTCGVVTGTVVDISGCRNADASSSDPFTAGSYNGNNEFTKGSLDEMHVFHTAISASVIQQLADSAAITIHADQTGVHISPTLYGLMFEDINHSGDGGLYAELIRNRSFLDSATSPVNWSLVSGGSSNGSIALDPSMPLNAAQPTSLKLNVTQVAGGQRVGTTNSGFWGIPVKPDTTYKASFYAKTDGSYNGPLTVGIESNDGSTVFAQATVTGVSNNWTKFTVDLTTGSGITPSSTNRFVISASNTGTIWLDMVSLFPPTWNNRSNGMRVDLMQKLQDMKPSFLRFPGGNYLEGNTIPDRFQWKNTIGNPDLRPGHQNSAWGYRSTDGLGLLEYLEWCKDLNVVPVLGVYAGYSLNGSYVPAEQLGPYVQDALDEIEYVTGAQDTVWGARRAADGHPEPFALPYVEIGNEDWFDRSGSYEQRYAAFYDAIKAKYPSIQLIATTPVKSRTMDVIDEHYYESKSWFVSNATRYDNDSRHGTGTKVFIGEYAAQQGALATAPPNLDAAIGEAAFMTGLERNSDLVVLASYAPLLMNVNAVNWKPDAIGYDAVTSYGAPSYYVQKLFGENHGDVVMPTTVDAANGNGGLYVVSSKDSKSGTMYVKVVNPSNGARKTTVNFSGIASLPDGTATVLTSANGTDTNSIASPMTVAPVTSNLSVQGTSLTYTFAANSLTVFRFGKDTGATPTLSQVTLKADKSQLKPGENVALHLSGTLSDGTPADMSKASVTYSTSNGSVVSVDLKGNLSAIKDGTAEVKALVSLNGKTVESAAAAIMVDGTPPVTTAAVNPSLPDGLNGWYAHPATVTLSASDHLSGAAKTEYSLDEGAAWQLYTAPVTFNKDSKYAFSYRSTDNVGNTEAAKSISFNLDATAPAIAVSGLAAGSSYSDSDDLTPQFVVTDDLSGVDISKTTVTLDTYSFKSGIAIPLYTLSLGSHTFIVTSSDLAGNQGSEAVTIKTEASLDSLKSLVTRFTQNNWIDNAGIANSLQAKLTQGNMGSFLNEVQAQSGKHISSEAAKYLLRDARSLLPN
ncbi:LamG-like jellyroll fold domain-containing protein [Paenibacillus sp. Soil787]|uniref:LamG-like jellyroll fold domain-containing protein n=1 Tax=Paenibacillus sp. Soil787 TaxID=1736411 RepID=UPI0006F80C85|nr:LamG-like jellyroll fold domain-containing protein [Paenibacillus sp. Soil787]KRF42176.1 hypothetical protein ASG93_20950 [Paenibacillus sp. Soil787]